MTLAVFHSNNTKIVIAKTITTALIVEIRTGMIPNSPTAASLRLNEAKYEGLMGQIYTQLILIE